MIYLIYGKETYLKELELKKIKKQFPELIPGINYITLDESNIGSLKADVDSPAFGYDKKLIIVKNPKKIEELDVPEEVTLVYISEEESKLKNAIMIKCDHEKPAAIAKRLKEICNAYGVNIGSSELNYFIETCGTEMQELINEIRKLIEYSGKGGTITGEDIDILSTKHIEARIFDLTDSLGKKDIKNSLDVLHDLLYLKEPIQKILITLYNHFKKLYLTKINKLELKANQTFLLNKYRTQANYFTEAELRRIMKELTDLDANSKIGLIDSQIGLEAILCTYV